MDLNGCSRPNHDLDGCLFCGQVRERKENASSKEERDSAGSLLKVFKLLGRPGRPSWKTL